MISVGSIVEGTVVSVMPFGVFVDIGNKQSGLVHISEISSRYVKDINECIKKGDTVKAKVIKIDDAGKISLSIRQANEEKRESRPRAEKKNADLYVLLKLIGVCQRVRVCHLRISCQDLNRTVTKKCRHFAVITIQSVQADTAERAVIHFK